MYIVICHEINSPGNAFFIRSGTKGKEMGQVQRVIESNHPEKCSKAGKLQSSFDLVSFIYEIMRTHPSMSKWLDDFA